MPLVALVWARLWHISCTMRPPPPPPQNAPCCLGVGKAVAHSMIPRVRRQDVQGSSGATRGIRLRDGCLEFSHRAVHFKACFGFWLLAVVFVHGRWLLVGVAFGNAIRKALSLIHDVIVFFDVVAHKRLLGPLDTELNLGMGSVGIPDVFINQERKLGARRRSDTVLVSTINDADQGSADVAFRTPLAPYEKSKFLGSGGSMVARLKLKGIDGRAPPGVEPAA
ncbi:hypothetical protein QVD17_41832 [Tagetes erecta]|uniref:Uncharacterized protein n=1 Tax=Tagetes erecta TaxID=13708 RepID=A0AAD8JN58_TARER|nr:hypothetical protein QVD17_41832 [Tagetes erecta]